MYYEINEDLARRCHEMTSFFDYAPGSATAEYRAAVDAAAALTADRKRHTSPFYHSRLDSLLDSYARRLAAWTNAYNTNGASCPSVLICGPANFPTAKKCRQNAREDALWAEYRQIEHILTVIRSVGTGPIDFADPNAREMLSERVKSLEDAFSQDEAMNAHYRRQKTMAGFADLTPAQSAALDAEILRSPAFAQSPCPDYELSSLRGKLKRARKRLEEYERLHAAPADASAIHFETTCASGEIVRNADQNRLQILFNAIPDADLRAALKANGFRWSPKNQAWQRQLTDNALRAARSVLGL